jgi:hypothetical protein
MVERIVRHSSSPSLFFYPKKGVSLFFLVFLFVSFWAPPVKNFQLLTLDLGKRGSSGVVQNALVLGRRVLSLCLDVSVAKYSH